MGKITPLTIPINGTNLKIMASLARGRGGEMTETILYPTFAKGISLPQARELSSALVRAITWCEKNGARGKGVGGVDTAWVDFSGDNPTLVRRKLLMATDDSLFCVGRRTLRAFSLHSHPVLNIEEWDFDDNLEPVRMLPARYVPVNCPAAMQAAVTISKVVKMCEGWTGRN